MKFMQLITQESLVADPGPASIDSSPLANIDPKDIPLEVLSTLTPTLEVDGEAVVFPDEFTPASLRMEEIGQTRKTMESLTYTTDLAQKKGEYLQETLSIVQGVSEITPVSASSVLVQLENINTVIPEVDKDLGIIEAFKKELTSEGPVNLKIATMEAISTCLGGIREIVLSGMETPELVKDFVTDINMLTTMLTTAHFNINQVGGTADTIDGIIRRIGDGLERGYSLDESVRHINQDNPDGSLVDPKYLTSLRIGLSVLRLENSRVFDRSDINTVGKFLGDTIGLQNKLISFLERLNNISHTTEGVIGAIGEIHDHIRHEGKYLTTPGKTYVTTPGWMECHTDERGIIRDSETKRPGYGFLTIAVIKDVMVEVSKQLIPRLEKIFSNDVYIKQLSRESKAIFQKYIDAEELEHREEASDLRSDIYGVIEYMQSVGCMVQVSTEACMHICVAVAELSIGAKLIANPPKQ